MFPPAPGSTLFPYTTLFRSQVVRAVEANEVDRAATVGEPAAQHAFQHLTAGERPHLVGVLDPAVRDRKSTRLNSSHVEISYAVFCLKKKITNGPWTHLPSMT